MILNFRFTASITYHNSLHGFWAGCCTGTANLEVKLIQKVVDWREAVLHEIFLDLHKAYDALDRSRCLDILEGCGMGNRSLRLLCRYWERLNMVAWVGGYYAEPFHGERGITQFNPLSPTTSNVVVEAVVRHWEFLVEEQEGGAAAMTLATLHK